MRNVWREERGATLLLVLALLARGPLLLTPMLRFTFIAQNSGQIQTRILKEQYSRDGGSEYTSLTPREYGSPPALPRMRSRQMELSLAVTV